MTAGQMLAHYRILERLGAGGMGVVYKALDTHLNRTVAIKVLPPEAIADPGRRQRFIQEAHAASALDHPNIVTVYDIAEAEGQYFMVMQYVAGRTLRAVLSRGAPALADTLRYAIQMADALSRAHGKGIVHRDLKPENVMVTDEGQIKILDFGLAKLTESPDPVEGATLTAGKTEEGQVVGTAAYMSPEQAQGKKVDARSDIFSFGVVLYEMVAGRQPFRGDNRLSVLSAVVRDEPEKPAAAPPDLERLIGRALRKDPERRAQSMADLRNALADLREETESGGAAAASGPVRRRRLWVPVAAAALLAVGAAVWFRFGRPQSEAALPPPRVVPFTSFPGWEVQPAFSPDGNQVAFVWNGENGDNFDIYLKLIDGGTPLRLTTNPAIDCAPAWSPDGRRIAFYRQSGGRSEIFVVSALGGPERKLGESVTASFGWAFPRSVTESGLAWSPDGASLAIVDKSSPQEPFGIFLLSTDTGEKRRLTTSPVESLGDTYPVFSPDGQTLAFLRVRVILRSDIYLLPVARGGAPSGEPRRLTSDDRSIWGLTWTHDNSSVIFSSDREGRQRLWKVAAAGSSGPRSPELVAGIGEDAHTFSLSRHSAGRALLLAYEQYVRDNNVWRTEGPASAYSEGPPRKWISSTRLDRGAQYSWDGKRIVFECDRSGHDEIWVCDSDGSNQVQLTSFRGPSVGSPQWSPDGTRIAFDSLKEGHRDIYVVGAEGGLARRLTTESSDDVRPSWSRDGQWVYFGSNRSGAWQVSKAPVGPAGGAPPGPGRAVQVTRNGGREARESLDGKFVYYTKLGVPGLWRVPVEGGDETQVLEQPRQGGWAVMQDGICFLNAGAASGLTIEFFSFATHRLRRTKTFPKELRIDTGSPHFAVSPDGRWILYTQMDKAESDIMLVENFR